MAMIWALLAASSAYAVEWLPEFQSLTESEEAVLEGPSLLGPEYQSDVLAYTRPEAWEYDWLTRSPHLDFSAGSLGSKHFLIEDRVKLRKRLSDPLEFRFTFFEEKNFERDSSHYVLEFNWWFLKNTALGLYGEPSLYKRNDDTGIAVLYHPSENHEIRLFNTFVDVTRLRRNDRADIYIEPDLPYSRGIVGRLWSDPGSGQKNFFEYALRHETRTLWRFPIEGYDYTYWKEFGSVFLGQKIGRNLQLYKRLQVDRKFESRTPFRPDIATPTGSVRTDRLMFTTRLEFQNVGPHGKWNMIPGLQFTWREWKTNQGDAIHRDLLPNLWLSIPAFGEGAVQDRWDIGVDTQWHRSFGPRGLFDPADEDGVLNSRLNVIYDFRFRENTSLRLLASMDLDKFGQFAVKESWEGGSGQLKIVF